MGWGSSIEVGRLARAAENALAKGDYNGATNYAERATQSAPQDSKLWFLLGYTARLAGRNDTSLNAYNHGLAIDPSSVEGLSGKAQTYVRMGRTEDAKRILLQVIAANPKRDTDLLVAGELFMTTGDTQRGLEFLQRAEAMKPSSHAELLMATAYMKLHEPQRAKQLLEEAKARSPRNTDIFRAVANYYREVHDYKGAIDTLRTAPQMTPEVLADLGYSYELNGDTQHAAEAYSRAANADPKQLGYQLSAAQAELRVSDLAKTREYIARSEQMDPRNYRLHAIKAMLAKAENRPADAIEEYKIAIQNMPNEGVQEGMLYPIQLRLNLAELYREQGDTAAAKQVVADTEALMSKLQVEGPAKAEFLRIRAAVKSAGDDFEGAEADLKEALVADPDNTNVALQYANLLWRMKRKDDAKKLYAQVLSRDPKNRFALEGLGYLYREDGDVAKAAEYFHKFADAYPNDYVPYLALGDLFAAVGQYKEADADYLKAHDIAPTNAVIVANAINSAIEAHDIPLAGKWVADIQGGMQDDPRVMREEARYLFHQGKYRESANLAEKALKQLDKDRNASVYLAYDYYNLGRLDDTLALATKYEKVLPKEANFPLLAGHVHKQRQLLDEAEQDYTRAIEKDPKMVDAWVNRGYVLNDLQDPQQASADFHQALKLEPNQGVARLGLALSDLQLRRAKEALDQVEIAEKLVGESGATHLVRATAYRQERLLAKAEKEYRAALRYSPQDIRLQLALADTLYYMRRYNDALLILKDALALQPDDPFIYAQMAHASAQLRDRNQTLQYVQLAEKSGGDQSQVLLATGDALLTLGDREAAQQRFTAALEAPDADRVNARLAFARLMMENGHWEDARQQVGLAFAESRIGEASPLTADNLVEAGNIFLAMHDFDLARRTFERAKAAGAADEVIAIALANTDLAQGNTAAAQTELAALGNSPDLNSNYDYKLAMATIYRQRHEDVQALAAFAQANQLAGDDDAVASLQMQEVAGEQGLPITEKVRVQSDAYVAPIFEDATIYALDARLFGGSGSTLPPPRSSIETRWTNSFKYKQDGLPLISGFVQLRNAVGQISLPSQALIINRNTFDTAVNGALNPVLHIGRNSLVFNTGLQFTIRRDKESPIEMNQNLLREFVYMSSNSFFNWISVQGSAYHESGPFTLQNLSSRDLGGNLQFTVGHPWAKTSLITGFAVRDLQFNPLIREFYQTSTYAGISRQIGTRLKVTGLGEYIRSWRVQDTTFVIAQAARPAAQAQFLATKNWTVDAAFSFSRGMGIHDYDNVQSGFLISYVKPLRRSMNDGTGAVPVDYPLRFSFGVQQEDFFNFAGRAQAIWRPVVRLSLF